MKKLVQILFVGTCFLLLLTATQLSYAEEAGNAKELIVEAVYLMGQNDTPAKAEEQVLLRAKRNALEKVSSFQFTAENIAALPSEAFAVTILDKQRSLNGDVMEFRVKIQAVVYCDKLEAAIKIEIKPIGYFRQIVRSRIGCPSYTDPHYSNAKEWVSQNAQRIEVTKFGPERKVIKIIRNDRKVIWYLGKNRYYEDTVTLQQAGPAEVPQTKEELQGTELIQGVTATKKLRIDTYKDGKVIRTLSWIDPKTNMPLKQEERSNRSGVELETEYFSTFSGPLDPALFKIPNGYIKCATLDEVLSDGAAAAPPSEPDPFSTLFDTILNNSMDRAMDKLKIK